MPNGCVSYLSTSMNESPLPPLVAVLAGHVTWLRAVLNASERHAQAYEAKERVVVGDVDDWQLSCRTERISERIRKDMADARHRIVKIAERFFAPAGATLEIDGSFGQHADWESSFDVRRFWAELDAKYRSAGADLAFGAVARRLVREFDELKSGADIRAVGGCPVLEIHTNGNMWGSQFKERAAHTLNDFAAVAGWADILDDQIAFEFKQFVEFVRYNRGRVTAHQKVIIPEVFTAVLFNSKIELRLLPAFAEKLQIFVARYLPADFEAAA